jgi:DNA-binding NarL/FixJ family response regulator
MKPIRVLLAEDHGLVRASMKNLLEVFEGVEVVGEARDGREALELVAKHQPQIVLMDISMPGLNGLEATRRIVKDHPHIRIIVLSAHSNEDNVLQALRAGASAYVLKASEPVELELAIESVMRGERFLSPAISKQVIDAFLTRSPDWTN